MAASGDVNRVHAKFKENVQFLLVYIREAHPKDGWAMGKNSTINDPTDQLERNHVASQCGKKLKFNFPIVVDTMDDAVSIRWGAWPERLFVIDQNQKVIYAGKQGPFGFWPTLKWKMKKWKGVSNRSDAYSDTTLEEFLLKLTSS